MYDARLFLTFLFMVVSLAGARTSIAAEDTSPPLATSHYYHRKSGAQIDIDLVVHSGRGSTTFLLGKSFRMEALLTASY
jgi:hypothetical protein